MSETTATPPPQESAPQAPATAPAPPAAQPVEQPKHPLNDAFSELDKLMSYGSEPKKQEPAKPEPAKTPADDKKQPAKDQKQQPPSQKPAAKDKEDPDKPAETPLEDKPKSEGKGGHVASLREAYETAKKRIVDLEGKLNAPREDPERKILSEKYESASKRIAQLEQELRESAYERSDDYKQQFEQPILNAFQRAYEDVEQLEVELEDGTTKKLTKSDFNAILQMPIGQATREVAKLGPAAAVMLQHRLNIMALHERRNKEVENARKRFAEKQDSMRSLSEKDQVAMRERWKSVNDEAKSKYPDFFAPDDSDEEGNALLQKGYEIADLAFSGRQMTPEEQVNLHAAIRNKAGAFDRMVYRNRKLNKRVEELEAELADYRKSEPSVEGTKREDVPKPSTWESEFDEMVRGG